MIISAGFRECGSGGAALEQKVMAEARAVAKATRLDDLLARYEQAAEPVNPFANDTAGRIEVPLAPQTAPPIAPKTSPKKP